MKRQVLASSAVLWMVLAVCICSGCKKADEPGPETGVGAASNSAAATAAMSDWPSNLPKFKGGQLAKISKGGEANVFRGAMFTQIKNPESAFQAYKAALESKGWVLDADASNEVTWAGTFTQGTKDLHVSVSKDGLMANLMYSAD